MAEIEDDEPSFLLTKHEERMPVKMQLDKNMIVSSLLTMNDAMERETNLWYLDNRASNHMTTVRSRSIIGGGSNTLLTILKVSFEYFADL